MAGATMGSFLCRQDFDRPRNQAGVKMIFVKPVISAKSISNSSPY
jgi:hypothetical protein